MVGHKAIARKGAGLSDNPEGQSKRKRPESSRPHNPYAATLNPGAAKVYKDSLLKRRTLVERVFAPGEADGNLLRQIRDRGWENLVREDTPPVQKVVLEFYANLALNPAAPQVLVRGVMVDLSAPAINALYGLPPVGEDVYDTLTADPPYDRIIQELCCPGTVWSEDHKDFPASGLSRYGRAWFGFICSNIMPNLRSHSVTGLRAILLFAICSNLPIDIGRILVWDITTFAQFKTTANTGHQCLITRLCIAAGVPIDPDEPRLALPTPTDSRAIARLLRGYSASPNPDGLGFIEDAEEPAPAPVPHHHRQRVNQPTAASSSSDPGQAFPSMLDLYHMMNTHMDMHRREQEWMTEMGERHVLEHTHRAEWERVYAERDNAPPEQRQYCENFPDYPERLREPFQPFPEWPTFPQYQPPPPYQPPPADPNMPDDQPGQFPGSSGGGPYWGM